MKSKIGIINIGTGNLYSLEKSLSYLNQNFITSSDPNLLKKCDKFILPGVGAFHSAMQMIKKKKLDKFIFSQVKSKKNILGICLGMQLLGSESLEFKKTKGLNLNDLFFKPFRNKQNKIDFHIGFNEVNYPQNSKLFKGVSQNSDFYFVHALFAKPQKEKNFYGISKYKNKFVASYENGNIFGVQFHPEKSHKNGIQILKNFSNL